MHEYHAVENIFRQALVKSQEYKAQKVTRVNLSLGELLGFDEGSIQLYFQQLAEGTILQEAELIIHRQPPKLKCRDCHSVFEDPGRKFRCPHCCGMSLILHSGKELYLENLEIET
jgi:hydrogenase nickel incorporation protein HypA/HybF